MASNVGINNGININIGNVDQTQAVDNRSQQSIQAQSAMSALDPLSVLTKLAEVMKGVLGSVSG